MLILKGIPASPGVAVGAARVLLRAPLEIPVEQSALDPAAELGRFDAAVAKSVSELRRISETAALRLNKNEASIFDAHIEMAEDPGLREGVTTKINGGMTAESAASAVIRDFATQFEAIEDEYFRARAADVRDVGGRILRNILHPDAETQLDGASSPMIIVAGELLPSDVAGFDVSLVAGFDVSLVAGIATEKGGATSHASILARSLGIPCVAGAAGLLAHVATGTQIALDGGAGELIISPDSETLNNLLKRADDISRSHAAALVLKSEPAVTPDGKRIVVMANAGSVDAVTRAIENGAEGIGLFRTEFLFLDRNTMPSEQEQAQIYSAAAHATDGRPIYIRLLDIGGDKQAPYLNAGKEENPFLGLRSIRLLLERPEVLRAQVRAILTAASFGTVSILVPMVAVVEELLAVKKIIGECRAELERDSVTVPEVPVGIMIEVPSAALCAEQLAVHSDFFSIGTNDLTQYCMAADRGNPAVAHLYQTNHYAVKFLIGNSISGAHRMRRKCGVCGEAASDPVMLKWLIENGIDSVSVSPAAVPEIKERIRGGDTKI